MFKSSIRAIKECGKLWGTRRDLSICISLGPPRRRQMGLDVKGICCGKVFQGYKQEKPSNHNVDLPSVNGEE